MTADQLKPGTAIEWANAPDFAVSTRLTIHGRSSSEAGKLWVSHDDGTLNLLSVESILKHARIAR